MDCENEVFDRLYESIVAEFPDADISSDVVRVPSSFPHVSIVMNDTYDVAELKDSGNENNFSSVAFEINVYSNKTSGKKSECKKIVDVINREMSAMNFTKTAQTPVLNMDDYSIYRIVSRYNAVTDDGHFYRR